MAALIAAGHRRIGFLTLPPALVAHGLRLEGYRQALAEAGIPYDPALVINADRDGTPEERAVLTVAVEALSQAVGATGQPVEHHDLDFAIGSWVEDPAFEKARAEHDRVDPKDWA